MASLLGLDPRQTVWAIANAASVTGGLWQMRHEPVLTKQWHGVAAAVQGSMAAWLAQAGVSGPASVLEGVQGLYAATAPDARPQSCCWKSPDQWLLEQCSFKPWPACRFTHPCIDAALQVRGQLPEGAGADDIASAQVHTHADAIKFCDNPSPQTELQAKFSLQHCAALALSGGGGGLSPTFAPESPGFARLQPLRDRVQVVQDAEFTAAYPGHYGAQVQARTASGQEFSARVRDAWGDPEIPMEQRTGLREGAAHDARGRPGRGPRRGAAALGAARRGRRRGAAGVSGSEATGRLLDFVCGDWRPDAATRAAARVFLLDSLGVGLSGARLPWSRSLVEMTGQGWSDGGGICVWGSTQRLSPPHAAMVNAYQMHSQEFDCVHEEAVVHPMAVVLACLLAQAERQGGVSGERLLTAVCVSVEVAALLGVASGGAMRFFRPGICGGMAATAGMARLAGMDQEQTRSALGIAYSQLGGTMQAHLEGSPTLPMQIAFNARNAVTAIDMAQAGLQRAARLSAGAVRLLPAVRAARRPGRRLCPPGQRRDPPGEPQGLSHGARRPGRAQRAAAADAGRGGAGRAGGAGAAAGPAADLPPGGPSGHAPTWSPATRGCAWAIWPPPCCCTGAWRSPPSTPRRCAPRPGTSWPGAWWWRPTTSRTPTPWCRSRCWCA